jgi:hypothetical protein
LYLTVSRSSFYRKPNAITNDGSAERGWNYNCPFDCAIDLVCPFYERNHGTQFVASAICARDISSFYFGSAEHGWDRITNN